MIAPAPPGDNARPHAWPLGPATLLALTAAEPVARLRLDMAPPAAQIRIGLVGSGHALLEALERLRLTPTVTVVVVGDVSGQTEGGRLARRLGIPVVAHPMEVFGAGANVVLEVNGDDRQYERLLAVKPPGVEVMSRRGTGLLLGLLARTGDGTGVPSGAGPRAFVIVAHDQPDLYDYLMRSFQGVPGVEVIADRRRGERRHRIRSTAAERRRVDRRRHPEVAAELRARGFAIARTGGT